jgi:plastocyanin
MTPLDQAARAGHSLPAPAVTLRPSPAVALAGIVLALVLAACGGSNASSSPVATTTVDLPPSYRFEPAVITVQAGATVTWTNHDNFTHNVTLEGQSPLTMPPGASATHTFDSAGTYAYVCSLHPQNMKGTVIVTGP